MRPIVILEPVDRLQVVELDVRFALQLKKAQVTPYYTYRWVVVTWCVSDSASRGVRAPGWKKFERILRPLGKTRV
jgi:hypothetical protein